MGVRSSRLARLRPVFGALFALCLMFAAVPEAHADEPRERARALFSEGVAAFARGEYAPAYEAFAGAYKLAPHASVRLNLGHCQERLGHPVAARANFRAYLAEASDISPSQREDVEAAVARVEGRIGRITVDVTPPGAQLFLDDQPVNLDNAGGIDVSDGSHVLRATADGAAPVTRTVSVGGATTQHLVFTLTLAPPLAVAAAEAGEEPLQPTEEAADTAPRAGARKRSLRPWIIGVGALAVATAAGSLGIGLAAKHADNDFEHQVRLTNDPTLSSAQHAQARSDGLDAVDRTHRFARISDGLLGATVGLAAVTATLVVVQYRRARQENRRYSAGIGPTRGGAAFSLLGRF